MCDLQAKRHIAYNTIQIDTFPTSLYLSKSMQQILRFRSYKINKNQQKRWLYLPTYLSIYLYIYTSRGTRRCPGASESYVDIADWSAYVSYLCDCYSDTACFLTPRSSYHRSICIRMGKEVKGFRIFASKYQQVEGIFMSGTRRCPGARKIWSEEPEIVESFLNWCHIHMI